MAEAPETPRTRVRAIVVRRTMPWAERRPRFMVLFSLLLDMLFLPALALSVAVVAVVLVCQAARCCEWTPGGIGNHPSVHLD
jgi:hypothetical protein